MLILKNLPWCHCVQVWLWSFVEEIQRTREQTLEIGTNLLSNVLFMFFKICKITWLALLILLSICLHIHSFKLHESFEVQYNCFHGIVAKLNLLELLIQFSIFLQIHILKLHWVFWSSIQLLPWHSRKNWIAAMSIGGLQMNWFFWFNHNFW